VFDTFAPLSFPGTAENVPFKGFNMRCYLKRNGFTPDHLDPTQKNTRLI